MSAVAAPPSPYKGLAPFEDSDLDALLFFGREREIEVIVANLMAARFTVLYGPSGVGKTSLLRAGVAHRLRRTDGALVVIQSAWTGDPVAELLDAVESAAGDGVEPVRRSSSLADTLAVWARRLDSDLYIVLDQFDEYFLYREGERGPGTLAEELPEALRRGGLRANFLLGIREDSLARLDAFKARIPNLFANSLRLDRLDRSAARAAIVGPLDRYKELVPAEQQISVEPQLVEAVLDQVAVGRVDLGQSGRGGLGEEDDAGRIEAPYLQLVLERLWEVETAEGSRRLRLETLNGLGGAAHIVEDHLERAMSELSREEKDAAAAIYNHLVTPSGTKIAHRAGDLAGYASVDEAETQRVLNRLVEERIVRAGENGAEGARYEIFHDVLAEAVLAWRTRHEAERRFEAERLAAARRHRRLLIFAVGALALIGVLAAVAVYALVQRHDARRQEQRARGRELAALASTAAATDPEGAVRDALAATNYERSLAIEDVLRTALRGLRVKAVLPVSHGPVMDVDFSPDGRRLVTAGGDGTARVYRASDGKLLLKLGRGKALSAAVFNDDGSKIGTGGKDGVARIWNARTGALLHELRHDGPITSVTFSHVAIATTSKDGTVRLWDVATGRLLHRLVLPAAVQSASFSGDGTLLVTALARAAQDRAARVYDVESGDLVEQLVQRAVVTTARFAPTGPLVVTGGTDNVARVWDVRQGLQFREPVVSPIHELVGHSGPVLDAEFSPSDDFIVTASTDETARVWRTPTGVPVGVLPNHHNYVLRAVFSPDGQTVATASSDRIGRIFLPNGTLRATLVGHTDSVTDVAFSRDGQSVATASLDGTARLWDRRPQPDLELLGRQGAAVLAVSFGSEGRQAVSVGRNGLVRAWRLGRPGPPIHTFRVGSRVSSAALSADGGRVAVGTPEGAVGIWDVASRRETRRLPDAGPAIWLAFTRDGRSLAVVGRNRRVRVWDLGSRKARLLDARKVRAASFSPDGRRLVTAGNDNAARIWDLRTGELVGSPLVGHTKPLTSAAYSPNGRYIVTSSLDNDARVWDAHTGRLVWTLRGHFAVISNATFSFDSRWVLTAGRNSAGVWDMTNGRALFFLNGHDRLVTAAFSPRGWQVVTGGLLGTVKTYDCALCGPIDELRRLARERLSGLDH